MTALLLLAENANLSSNSELWLTNLLESKVEEMHVKYITPYVIFIID